jgi:nitroreductase
MVSIIEGGPSMDLNDLENLVKTRHSVRKYQAKPVPEEMLIKAIEIATWAPSGGNRQNWHFFVVTNKGTINAIADTVQASANLMSSWPEAAKFGDAFARSRQTSPFFRSAPAIIGVAASKYQSDADLLLEARGKVDLRAHQMREWRNSADSKIQSTSSAVAFLLLILHQMGLGAVWMTGPMQVRGEIERILNVEVGWELVTLIPVGYPAEKPETKGRKPVGEVTELIK